MRVIPPNDRFTGPLAELGQWDWWLDPDGNFAVVGAGGEWMHHYWAEDRGSDGHALYERGWVKGSGGDVRSEFMEVTQRQLDALADYFAAMGEQFFAASWRVI